MSAFERRTKGALQVAPISELLVRIAAVGAAGYVAVLDDETSESLPFYIDVAQAAGGPQDCLGCVVLVVRRKP